MQPAEFALLPRTCSVFQTIIDPSLLAVAKRAPEADTATRLTQSVCPCASVCKQVPLSVSHTRMDWSREQEIRKSACEGMNAKPDTSCSWPTKVFYTVNVCRFQSLIAMSVAQDASSCPF